MANAFASVGVAPRPAWLSALTGETDGVLTTIKDWRRRGEEQFVSVNMADSGVWSAPCLHVGCCHYAGS
jgi:hypothetical protein